MFDALEVQSHAGRYPVHFGRQPESDLWEGPVHVLADARVVRLHGELLSPMLDEAVSVLEIEASERAKSLELLPNYVSSLATGGVRRGQMLLCVGGGVLQDIACFLAGVMYRGLPWSFVPTTLLAQADSCIGSKSSINVGPWKNIVGTFTPPRSVVIWPGFLDTLSDVDIRSGVGEMLKVHAIQGPRSFDEIGADYPVLLDNRDTMLTYVHRSLSIKKRLIEIDEFDEGPRLALNYGHSFGHAIESATDFGVPHGIAVTVGMDLANFVAAGLGVGTDALYRRMHPVLRRNYAGFEDYPLDADVVASALLRDKKNVEGDLRLLLPDSEGRITLVRRTLDTGFRGLVRAFLSEERAR